MRTVTAFTALLGTLLLIPAPARPQAAIDAERTSRIGQRYYLGAGLAAALGSGGSADLALRGGRVLGENLQVGLEAGFSYRDERVGGDFDDPTVDSYFIDATITLFPVAARGAFLKAGAGYGSATTEWPDGERRESRSGASALVSAGWEFSVSEKTGLGIELGAIARPGLEEVDPRWLLTLTRYWGRP